MSDKIIVDISKLQPSLERMTLRDWFAGMALNWNIQHYTGSLETLAKQAYVFADAMIEEREK